MSEDGQRGPGSGGTAHRGRPGAGQARQNGGGESPPGDSQDHAGTPRPHALIPALDEGQLAALREIGREWDRYPLTRKCGGRHCRPTRPWASTPRPASSARPCSPGSCPSRDEAGSYRRSRLRAFPRRRSRRWARPGTEAAALRPAAGRHRDRGGADAQARGAPRAVGGRAVLGRLRPPGDAGRPAPGLPGLSYSLPVGAAIAFLMLAVGISYRQTIRAYPQGGGSFIVASEELGRVRAVVANWSTTSGPCTSSGRTSH